MTTKEIAQKISELTKEINKVKGYATTLSKKLIEHEIEVPVPNWTETEKETELETQK